MKINLFSLKQRLQERTGRKYSWTEIAERIGAHPHTVRAMGANKREQVTLENLSALLRFFREEGMEVTIADLLIEERGELTPVQMGALGCVPAML